MIDLDDVAGPARRRSAGTCSARSPACPSTAATAYDAARARSSCRPPTASRRSTFCGMGGSAVAGDVVRAVFRERLGVPVDVNRGPDAARVLRARTRSWSCSSYSGNTSETLVGVPRGARARVPRSSAMTSGGTLADEAAEAGVAGGARARRASSRGRRSGTWGSRRSARSRPMGLLPALADDVEETVAELAALVGRARPRRRRRRTTPRRRSPRGSATGPGDLGRRGDRRRGGDALEDPDERERQGARVLVRRCPSSTTTRSSAGPARTGERFSLIALRHDGEHPEIGRAVPARRTTSRATPGVDDRGGPGARDVAARAADVADHRRATSRACTSRSGAGVDPTPVAVIERLKAALGGSVSVTQGLARARRRPAGQRRRGRARRAPTSCPASGVVLGSGLGPALGDALEEDAIVRVHRSARVPAAGGARARGAARRSGSSPACRSRRSSGRVHFYEGHGMDVPALLPRLARRARAPTRWC